MRPRTSILTGLSASSELFYTEPWSLIVVNDLDSVTRFSPAPALSFKFGQMALREAAPSAPVLAQY